MLQCACSIVPKADVLYRERDIATDRQRETETVRQREIYRVGEKL